MRTIHLTAAVLLLAAGVGVAWTAALAGPQKKEYLTDAEADKIRDAGATGPRIGLYAEFAARPHQETSV